jgi:hypothetical protein
MADDFNDLLRGAYATSRAKSARPVFHDQANMTPEDVRAAARAYPRRRRTPVPLRAQGEDVPMPAPLGHAWALR